MVGKPGAMRKTREDYQMQRRIRTGGAHATASESRVMRSSFAGRPRVSQCPARVADSGTYRKILGLWRNRVPIAESRACREIPRVWQNPSSSRNPSAYHKGPACRSAINCENKSKCASRT